MSGAGEILFEDGISSFGYGGHESGDEIMFGSYNVLTVLSKEIGKYDEFFKAHGIEKKNHLLTARETFDASNPGISRRVTVDEFSVSK